MDWEISVLGLGVMQLPSIISSKTNDSKSENIELIRYAIDHGVNYLNLGFPYHMEQHKYISKEIGLALKDGYREKIKVFANLPCRLINSYQDFDHYLNQQLQTLLLDKIDFCNLEGLDRKIWPKVEQLGVLQWADEAIKDGRIDHLGFAFHDDVFYLRDTIQAYDHWSHCEFQFSFMDISHHPGVGGLKFAAERGFPVIITEPLRGGRLVENLPDSVTEVWGDSLQKRSLTEWGMRSVWDHPEVTSIIGDIINLEQLKVNLALAHKDSSEPENLSGEAQLMLNRVRDAYRKLRPIQCTACRCCMPCRLEIDVPRIYEIYNDAIMYSNTKLARFIYQIERHNLEICVKCGHCEKTCPKRFPLLDVLDGALRLLES